MALAEADVPTSTVAMGAVVGGARLLAEALAPSRWTVFDKLAVLSDRYRKRVRKIDETLNDALCRDDHVTPLSATLQQCEVQALDLLAEAARGAPTPPKPRPPAQRWGALNGSRDVAAADVASVLTEIEEAIEKSGATRVAVDWRVYSDTSGETA